jgi:hypothetical protein
MTKQELLEKLLSLNTGDEELDHVNADRFLLNYIDDPDISRAFFSIPKRY